MRTLKELRAQAIEPALLILPAKMTSVAAEVMLLAIHLQEDPRQLQEQMGGGPAHGIFQFELGGGVKGVFRHAASAQHAITVCQALHVAATPEAVYRELTSTNDVLDAAFARLLLWTDALPLPAVGDVEAAWQCYIRTWRPGAYERGTAEKRAELRAKWGRNYQSALEAVRA